MNMHHNYRIELAKEEHSNRIWDLLQQGILKRKSEGSLQWQDGYPNQEVVKQDIKSNSGYIIIDDNDCVVAYIAVVEGIDPIYEEIEGKWAYDLPYVSLHRLVVDQINFVPGLGTWILQNIEPIIKEKSIDLIRVDTNFDNGSMLRVFEKLGYIYCGKVYIRGAERLAFEKLIS